MRPSSLLLGAAVLLAVRMALRVTACQRTPFEEREADARARLAGRRATDYALENIREEERAHIARELHDDLGQLLATLRVDMTLLLQQPVADDATRELLMGMDGRLMSAITSLRRIAGNLRPLALDEGGLYFALQSLRNDFEQRHGIDCVLDARESELVLNDRYSTAIFRIVQESLTNIARHANARRVRIALRRGRGLLHIVIEDNGRGIAQSDMNKPQSFGLLGMRERVWAIRGDIEITGNARGTRIVIHLPLPE